MIGNVKESAFQRTVVDLAQRRGWKVAHFRAAQNSRGVYRTPVAADGAGFPDLVLVRHSRLIFAELKRDGRYPSEKQREWLAALEEAAVPLNEGLSAYTRFEVYVWRPKDWNEIEKALM